LRLAIHAPQRSPNRVPNTTLWPPFPTATDAPAGPRTRCRPTRGKPEFRRRRATKLAAMAGSAARLLASATAPLSSRRSPASSAREEAPRPPISLVREDRAAPSRVARNFRLIDGRHWDQAANTAAMSGVDGIRLLYLAPGSSTRRHQHKRLTPRPTEVRSSARVPFLGRWRSDRLLERPNPLAGSLIDFGLPVFLNG
jgi:hypothetical protein